MISISSDGEVDMSVSELHEQVKLYLQGESSLRDLHRWVSEHLSEIAQHEGTFDDELAALIEHCFVEYALGGFTEKDFADTLRRFLKKKAGLPRVSLSSRQISSK
jgi:hypothetical protein